MASALEAPRDTVATMTEAEASRTLACIERLRRRAAVQEIADLLCGDPSIHVPPTALNPLPPVERPAAEGFPPPNS